MSQRESFKDSVPEERLVQNTGLKIGKKRNVATDQRERQASLDNAANQYAEGKENNTSLAISLGSEFTKIVNDKTLPDNKGPLKSSIEREVLGKWEKFILNLNNPPKEDLNTPEGYGSLAGILMAFKALLDLRDRLNFMDYNLSNLTSELTKVRKELDNLNTKVNYLEDEMKNLRPSSAQVKSDE